MATVNKKIGFNDFWVMLIGIPFTSFLIPIVFFGIRFGREPQYEWKMFLEAMFFTAVLWIGNRYIMIWARKKYPSFDDVKHRLLVQSLTMLLFTLLANNVLGYLDYLVEGVWLHIHYSVSLLLADRIINSNNASIFCTLTIITIYETDYFMNELRKSVEEKEMLKREALQSQLNALKTQVNPHFLFNNLNTLSSIIPENQQQAVDFVQQLSRVYRHILEVKDEKSISLKDELDVIQSYSFLLKTRFGNNIDINISVAEKYFEYKIPPLSLQLLIENAIKHNIISIDKPLHISISVVNDELVVANNLQKKNQVIESMGLGLNNIQNRYQLLTHKQVYISQTDSSFIVSLPLLND